MFSILKYLEQDLGRIRVYMQRKNFLMVRFVGIERRGAERGRIADI